MIRTLYTRPAVVDWPTLDAELRVVVPTFRGVNDVDGSVAVYTDQAPDTDAVAAVIAAHTVPPFEPLDATGVLATLLVVEGVLDIGDAAHSVGTTGEHLVHEATAWGVG